MTGTSTARAVWVVIGVSLALITVEGALRLTHVTPEAELRTFGFPDYRIDEIVGWSYVPNREFIHKSRYSEFSGHVKINSRGLREREYPYRKGSSAFRVLILGHSFTAAFEVDFERAWHKILERKLKEHGPTEFEVISASTGGWGTDQHLLYYANEGYKYDADIIVLQVIAPDVLGNDVELAGRIRREKPWFVLRGEALETINYPYDSEKSASYFDSTPSSLRPKIGRLLRRHLHTYRLVRNTMVARAKSHGQGSCPSFGGTPQSGIPTELSVYAPHFPRQFPQSWMLTEKIIERLNQEVSRRGKRLIIVFFPERRQVEGLAWHETVECWPDMRALSWDRTRPNQLLGAFARERQIVYVDLTPAFRDHVTRNARKLHYQRDIHFNLEGHELAANEIYRSLMTRGLVP